MDKGCENCHEDWNRQEAYHNITSNFKGIISITNPKYSWAARWLHKSKNKYFTKILKILANLIPGFYCIDIISDNKEDDEENDEYEEEIENEEEEN